MVVIQRKQIIWEMGKRTGTAMEAEEERKLLGRAEVPKRLCKGGSTQSGLCLVMTISLGFHLSTEVKTRLEGAQTKQTVHSMFRNHSHH